MKSLFKTYLRYFFIALLSIIAVSSCIDRFNPDLSDITPEDELVVEGFISDEPGVAHRVKLTRTRPPGIVLESPRETGATVQLVDSDGNTHELAESDLRPGEYFTNPNEFSASVGESYQIKILLINGEEYESDFQQLQEVEPIDTLWHRQEEITEVQGDALRTVDVLNVFTSYRDTDEQKYYRYEYSGTFGIQAELQGSPVCWRNPQSVPEGLSSPLTCYANETVALPLNISTYPDPVVGAVGFDNVLTIPTNVRYSVGYSMVVKRFSLTKSYFEFLSQVKDQNDFGGSIFDPPPTQIVGNIRNVNDPEKFALGFFSTLAIDTQRTFIFPLNGTILEGRCAFTPGAPPPDDIPKFTDCCDCRQAPGAFTERPDFWF